MGSNVGDRAGMIARAAACLVSEGAVVLRKMSGLYVTAPWGLADQAEFLNAAVEAETHLSPAELLAAAKRIERCLGRVERARWGPREIDIDILFYGGQVVRQEGLTIPHPLVRERVFVLGPLAEIAPGLVDPETGVEVGAYLEAAYLSESEKGGQTRWTSPTT
ncbi:MAG: 2-amino-4-hydroxy-6-hydroxymethyldihydropteridine diphosphokinase [bacterium]